MDKKFILQLSNFIIHCLYGWLLCEIHFKVGWETALFLFLIIISNTIRVILYDMDKKERLI